MLPKRLHIASLPPSTYKRLHGQTVFGQRACNLLKHLSITLCQSCRQLDGACGHSNRQQEVTSPKGHAGSVPLVWVRQRSIKPIRNAAPVEASRRVIFSCNAQFWLWQPALLSIKSFYMAQHISVILAATHPELWAIRTSCSDVACFAKIWAGLPALTVSIETRSAAKYLHL